jgi:ABC-2 type transport system permease protein
MSVVVAGQRVRLLLLRRRLATELARGRSRAVGLGALAAGFAVVVFGVAFAGGFYVRWKSAPELLSSGTSAALTGLVAALVFSSLGHAAQAFFTAKDLWLWDSAPTGAGPRFVDRLTETAVAALPAVLALGTLGLVGWSLGGGLGAAGALRAIVAMLVAAPLPLCAGVVFAHVGGAILPAGRLRRASLLVLGVGVAAALVWFRRARVERLLTEEGAHELLRSAKDAGAVGPSWSPARWLGTFVVDGDVALLAQASAVTGTALLLAFGVHRALYDRARKLAVDESPTGVLQGSLAATLLRVVARPLPVDLRPMVQKDLLAFVRDPGQWGQVVLLVGVGVLYVVNASALGDGLRVIGAFGAVVLLAMHTGIVSFIAGGLAVRFAFPQVGLEGPAVWIVDGAPLRADRLLLAKLVASLPVVVFFPLALAGVGGAVLGFSPSSWLWSTALIAAVALAIAASATFRGALHPLFDATSLSELAIGPGAMSTMVLTTALAGLGALGAFVAGSCWYARAWVAGAAATGGLVVGGVVAVVVPVAIGTWLARRAFVAGAAALDERRVVGSAGGAARASAPAQDSAGGIDAFA